MKISVRCIILVILTLGAAGCLELDNSLFNTKELERYTLPGNTIPDSLIEEITLQSEEHTLYGFWVKSNGKRPGITLLYCHGNKHNIDNYWNRVVYLHELGYNILIFDYRGYGKSEGASSENGLYSDGMAALKFLTDEKKVNRDSIGYYGYSLGNVVSIWLAARIQRPLFLISEAPFASANSITQSGTGLDIPPRWLTEGTYDNAETVKDITTPFLLIHGEDDDFLRYRDNGKIVFENAPEPKTLLLVPGALHDNVPEAMGIDAYRKAVGEWVDSVIK